MGLLDDLQKKHDVSAVSAPVNSVPQAQAEAPTVPEPQQPVSQQEPKLVDVSMHTHARLCHVNICMWEGRKKDKRATQNYAHQVDADARKIGVDKYLLADNPHLKRIKAIKSDAREYLNRVSKPWLDRGPRIIPATSLLDARQVLEAFKAEYYTEVQNLLDGYSAAVDMAEEKAQSSSSGLGRLFNRDDYPSLGSLREKFSFKLAFIPLPKPEDDSDFRLQVGEEMKEYLKQSYKDYYHDQNREMMVRVYSDVRTRLVETKSKLDYGDKQTPTGFHNTLIDRTLEVVQMLKHFSFGDDPNLELCRSALEERLQRMTVDALRDSSRLRSELIDAINKVLNVLPQ